MQPKTIAVIPLDDRAVNYECVALLGEAASCRVLLPPKEWLGTPWRVGDMERLGAWLAENGPQADALLVAIDSLGYGGLVNSRRSADSLEIVLGRLELLRQLKQARPELTILAYSVLMRINRGDDAEEEKAYFAQYGRRLFRISYLEDRANMAVITPQEIKELPRLKKEVPAEILQDYLEGRARNHAVNRRMIEWTADGLFDYLIIPQDDTVAYGWNIAEGRALRLFVQQLGLSQRVSIYPGTDETDMLLLARYAAQQAGFTPQVWLRYSSAGADQVVTAYEDRPMTEMIKAHLGPLGGMLANCPGEADLFLYVNAPAEVQGHGPDQYLLGLSDAEMESLSETARQLILDFRRSPHAANTLREMHTVRRDLPEFVRALRRDLDSDRSCAVVDVAYVNSGDLALGDLLTSQVEVSQLAGYAGWNTAGNTLGSLLAQAVIRHIQWLHGATPEALSAHIRLLFLRLVEDYLFMSRWRTKIMIEDLPRLGARPTLSSLGEQAEAACQVVLEQLGQAAHELAQARFVGRRLSAGETLLLIQDVSIASAELPWGRLFDLTMEIDLRYALE